MTTNIKAIIFDLDGVYFKNGTRNFLDNLSNIYKIDRDEIVRIYLKSEEMRKYKRDEVSKEEYWAWAIKELKINITTPQILNLLGKSYEINTESIELLKKTRQLKILSIICSNNFRERIEVLENRFNFQTNFDKVILSYKYKKLKPNLLEEVAKETKLLPEEILLIDDSDYNIDYAKEIGYNTIFCKDINKLKSSLKKFDINI